MPQLGHGTGSMTIMFFVNTQSMGSVGATTPPPFPNHDPYPRTNIKLDWEWVPSRTLCKHALDDPFPVVGAKDQRVGSKWATLHGRRSGLEGHLA
jgi:hypothetical protein